jgi:hypothetical protein
MMIKMTFGKLKQIIRETLGAGASGTDPTEHDGFYSYEIPRGTDVHGFWYRSPGRPMGSDGDPSRPADAMAYIGMTPPNEEPASEEGESIVSSDSPGALPAEDINKQ